ncbi:MAG: hypothetical protein MZU95_16740 [Desulfomicrobium escambiense]|nr:hypothetical protein [Desulfomicrobium escambiense]
MTDFFPVEVLAGEYVVEIEANGYEPKWVTLSLERARHPDGRGQAHEAHAAQRASHHRSRGCRSLARRTTAHDDGTRPRAVRSLRAHRTRRPRDRLARSRVPQGLPRHRSPHPRHARRPDLRARARGSRARAGNPAPHLGSSWARILVNDEDRGPPRPIWRSVRRECPPRVEARRRERQPGPPPAERPDGVSPPRARLLQGDGSRPPAGARGRPWSRSALPRGPAAPPRGQRHDPRTITTVPAPAKQVLHERFGDYTLVALLGAGGMANVYEATRRGDPLALKRPRSTS